MGFVKPTDTPGQSLNVIYAEHILQLVNAFLAQRDAGQLVLLGQVAAPAAAPSVTLSAGPLSGSYQWATYWITGIEDGTGGYSITGRTTPSPYSAAQTLANQQGTVNIAGQAIPTGVVGWGVVRNQAGGGTWYEVPGSEQFMNSVGNMPTSYVDNTADANLVTPASSSNTTGTSLSGNVIAQSVSGVQAIDIITGKVSPNLVTNAGFESISSAAMVFSDALTSYSGTFNTGDEMGPWTVQSGSVTGGTSGVTSQANGTIITAGNAQWKPVVASDSSTRLTLTVQATFTLPSNWTTTNQASVVLYKAINSGYQATIVNNNFQISNWGVKNLTAVSQTISASTTYTIVLSLDTSGLLTAKLYSGSGTGSTLLQTLTTTDTTFTSNFLIGVIGDANVVMSSASAEAPWADSWTIGGDQRVAWALSQNAISGKYSIFGKGLADGVQGQAQQTLSGISTGNTYTLSGYMSTDNVGAGGASMSIYNGSAYPPTSSVTGTTQTQRYSESTTISTATPTIYLTINSTGTVTFDDIQLELGSSATPYVPQTQYAQTPIAAPSFIGDGSTLRNVLRTDSGAPNPQTVANAINVPMLQAAAQNVGPPTAAGNGAGTKVWLWSSASAGAYAIGVDSSTTWYSSNLYHKWYSQNGSSSATPTEVASIDGSGNITAAGSITSGGNTVVTSLGGGAKIQSGSVSASAGNPSSNTVTFPNAFSLIPMVVVTPTGGIHQEYSYTGEFPFGATSVSTSGFTLLANDSNGGTYDWIAIGD